MLLPMKLNSSGRSKKKKKKKNKDELQNPSLAFPT